MAFVEIKRDSFFVAEGSPAAQEHIAPYRTLFSLLTLRAELAESINVTALGQKGIDL